MSRRIDIELTSKRDDGSWTWRAAGAREPKGLVDDSLVPTGSSVKDVLRAEVESDLDGTRVLAIQMPKQRTARSGLLELIPSEKSFDPVVQTSARREKGNGGDRGPRRERGERRDRGERGERRDRGERGERRDRGERGERRDRGERGPRRPRFDAPPELPQRPKPKRVRPGRARRDAVLAELPEAHRPIAAKVLDGGIPAVRAAIEEQNRSAVSAGQEKIEGTGLVQLAENLLPRLRVADWLDRADAAKAIISDVDLRDLRAIVIGASDPAIVRDESTRAMAEELKTALTARLEEETKLWLDDIKAATDIGRVARALKLSSQPPKAGVRFPAPLAAALAARTTEALSMDAPAERWIVILEAAAFSPVRSLVKPAAPSSEVSADLTRTVMRLGPLMPQVAAIFGVQVDPKAPAPRPLRAPRTDKNRPDRKKLARSGEGKGRSAGRPGDRKPTAAPEATDSVTEPVTDALPGTLESASSSTAETVETAAD
ncbi:MAG: hypothetical protein RLZZ305_1076 [Actinomycetota bacterium]